MVFELQHLHLLVEDDFAALGACFFSEVCFFAQNGARLNAVLRLKLVLWIGFILIFRLSLVLIEDGLMFPSLNPLLILVDLFGLGSRRVLHFGRYLLFFLGELHEGHLVLVEFSLEEVIRKIPLVGIGLRLDGNGVLKLIKGDALCVLAEVAVAKLVVG